MKKLSKYLTKDLIKKLPKGELHYHLDGGLRVNTIMELAKEQKIELPGKTYEEISKKVKVPLDCQSLEQFLEAFSITLSVMQTKESIQRVIYEACEDATKDGVKYLEIRFSPVLHLEKGLQINQVIQSACDMIPVVEKKLPINLRFIICAMRHMSSDVSSQLARETLPFIDKGVVSFDLAGPEDGFPASIHKEAYEIILKGGFKTTCHAGEYRDGVNSIKSAIETAKVQRIGHGVALYKDQQLLEEVKKANLALEVCVTSNILTKFSNKVEEHPIDLLYKSGVNIVPCTDNTLMCDISLSDEYFLLHTVKNVDVSDLLVMMDNSFKFAFLPTPLKNKIRVDACNTFSDVLSVEGFMNEDVSKTIEKIRKEISNFN